MENTKKSNKKLIILIVSSVVVIIFSGLIAYRALVIWAYRAHKDHVIQKIEYSGYVQAMGGSVDWNQELEPVIAPDFVPDDRRVTMWLAFYNHENGCTLALEELKSQFAISKTETEGIDDLIAYSSFINKNGISEGKDETFNNYKRCCRQILIENGIDPDEATLEEITDAFNKAIVIDNYMVENGYGHYDENSVEQRLEILQQVDEIYEEEQNGE